MSSPRSDFLSGARVSVPLMLGIAPFGMVFGVAAVGADVPTVETVAMSVVIFAGASQLAAVELIGQNAPGAVVVATVLVINLRMMMYSASLAPHFERLSARWKALLSYLLTDQAYAASIFTFENDDVSKQWYFLGVAAPIWLTWQVTTIAGVALGSGVPDGWHLDFTVPLVFLALLIPAVTDRSTAVAAVVGGGVAVAAGGLPFNLGLITAAVAGIAGGLVTEEVA